MGNEDLPPMIFKDAEGQPTGLVVDVIDELKRKTGLPIEFLGMEWEKAQTLLRQGEGDALVQINRSPEREAYLDFSEPVITSEFSIFRASDLVSIQGLEGLSGQTVGVEPGGYPQALLEKYPDINVRLLESWAEGFDLIASGQIDALIAERRVGEYVMAINQISDITAVRKPIETESTYIAVRKGQTALLAQINQGLARMRADGSLDMIIEKWSDHRGIYVSAYEQQRSQTIAASLIFFVLFSGVLTVVNIQRKRALAELDKERAGLEARVAERTQELQRQTRVAQEASRAKSEFMASVSHELRTPLNAVIGFTEMLELGMNEDFDIERTKMYAANIGVSARALLGMIDDVLDTAKIEAGKLALNQEAFRLEKEIRDVHSAFAFKATEHDIQLILDMVNVDRTVSGDPIRFRQVFFNLLDNAIKFSDGGTVNITASAEKRDDEKVRLSIKVADNGVGIMPENLQKVFEPFTQTDASIVRHFGGAGLGLSIARRLAIMMGGDISVESTFGRGSTFEATFVFKDMSWTEKALSTMNLQSELAKKPQLGLTVLAVDDNETNLAVVATMLTAIGCDASTQQSGKEAIEWMKSNTVDVILMDLHMPGMSGIEAARAIQEAADIAKRPKIFAWTADGNNEPLLEGSGVDWAGTLLKPTTRSTLVSVLRQAIA